MTANPLTTWSAGTAPSPEQQRLAQILDEYLMGLERGEPLTPEDLLSRHPDVADRLRGYLSGLALFHNAVIKPVQPLAAISGDISGQELTGELGDFRLVREIGRGGMGVVYEGVQVSLGRRVALKVLPFSKAIDEKQITRFKHEAQAAAQVDHPNIVPVFAIGQERGIHYFAMQLIGGPSLSQLLDKWRDEADAEVAASADFPAATVRPTNTLNRVRFVAQLGIQAAQAMHAAHEIGVVHRDIKPSNLLIDEREKLWITDFGVARCKANPSLTETGHLLGTMPYMSPEQATGQGLLVDHRADIYSLGVTLYELATLRHPFEGVSDAALAFDFGRAGLRPPRHWNASVPVDFENIVLKAMAGAREDRYATARELAEDLGRFIDGKPILARRPSLTVRLSKWASRHKRSVAAAMGALSLAVAGLSLTLAVITSERAEKMRAYRAAITSQDRAEKNYAQAQAKFHQAREMLDRFGARVAQRLANDVPGAEEVRKELLDGMLPYYREFARESAGDPSLQADLALTFSKIGFLSDQLGSLAEAEQAYTEARKVLEKLVSREPARPEHRRSLALCCNNLGQLLEKRGAVEAGRKQLARALAIQEQLVKQSPSIEVRSDLATTHGNLGLMISRSGQQQEAAEHYRAAIQIQESILQTAPRDETNINHLAGSYNNLASQFLRGQPGVARQWIEKALLLQLALVREHPAKREYQSDLALSYNNLGAIYSRLARWDDAEKCYLDAMTIQGRLVAAAPLVTAYRRDLAVSQNNLGMMHTSAGHYADAQTSFEKALAIQQELADAHPEDVSLLSGLGGICNNLGMVHQSREKLTEACTAFQRAIAVQRHAHERAPEVALFRESLGRHYYNYAQVLRKLDRPADAAEALLARRQLWPVEDNSRGTLVNAEKPITGGAGGERKSVRGIDIQ
jgi:serine/threonine protein kinase/Flp pilus assembly protein TadD